ncbi:MAG TPA: hypothetical protein PL009_03345 [Flavipsychrobacter sp.]|nr:hypothetical protein [Flavipsychrobacter sp.]
MKFLRKIFISQKRIETVEEALNMWRNPPNAEAPSFPLMHYEYFPPVEVFLKHSIESVVYNPDYLNYRWGDLARFIDATGKVYKCKYEFGIMFPEEVEQILPIEDIRAIIIDVLTFQMREFQRDYNDLIKRVQHSSNIAEMISLLSEEYEE